MFGVRRLLKKKDNNDMSASDMIVEDARRKFEEYYSDTDDIEILNMLGHIRETNSFQMLNTTLAYDYDFSNVPVEKEGEWKYVWEKGKRLYFPEHFDENKVREMYGALKKEQDPLSPHQYLTKINYQEIYEKRKQYERIEVIELGAMEGMFSLSLVDFADKVTLFECNDEWVDALNRTFSPWNKKTTIFNKFVARCSDNNNQVCIDDIIECVSGTYYIIKMDIEGMEREALAGMRKLLSCADNFLLLVCTYHRADDESVIRDLFKGCNIESTRGYFCFYVAEDYAPPYVRRCVLKISKK